MLAVRDRQFDVTTMRNTTERQACVLSGRVVVSTALRSRRLSSTIIPLRFQSYRYESFVFVLFSVLR